MISGIIKVEESVISLIIHWFMENIQQLLREMQADFICDSKNTRTNATSGGITRNQALAKGVLRMRTARGIICGYNWIKKLYYNHACPQNHAHSPSKQGALWPIR